MRTIHDRAQGAAKQFKRSEIELINIIQEIDEKKVFFEKKYTSTFAYCVGFLKLSDNLSLDLIAIARASKKVPELKKAIQNESLTASKARRITSVITKENASHWLSLAQNVSKEKLEKEIAKVRPQVLTPEKAKYVTENRLKLELGISEEFMKTLKRAQEILCQKSGSYKNFEATLSWALEEIVRREDPLKKAERAVTAEVKRSKKETIISLCSNKPEDQAKREGESNKILLGPGRVAQRIPLDAHTKHLVNLRDQARCTFKDEKGERCGERKWMHIHHKLSVSNGGGNNPENLVSLCSAHHDLAHRLLLPLAFRLPLLMEDPVDRHDHIDRQNNFQRFQLKKKSEFESL
jgi:hypothetical protein